MIRTLRLRTERLELRRFSQSDAEACYRNWMSDPEVTRFLSWDVHPDAEDVRRLLEVWEGQYELGSFDWCITLRGSDEPVGSITAVRDFPEDGYCEIGYCLKQDLWDRGYMSEAIRAVVNYIFDVAGYDFIMARHDLENEASGRCLEKCMFKEYGRRDLPDPKTGRVRTYRFMRILRRDVQVYV